MINLPISKNYFSAERIVHIRKLEDRQIIITDEIFSDPSISMDPKTSLLDRFKKWAILEIDRLEKLKLFVSGELEVQLDK